MKVKKATTIVGLTFSSGELDDHLAAGVGQQQSPSLVQTGSGGVEGVAGVSVAGFSVFAFLVLETLAARASTFACLKLFFTVSFTFFVFSLIFLSSILFILALFFSSHALSFIKALALAVALAFAEAVALL